MRNQKWGLRNGGAALQNIKHRIIYAYSAASPLSHVPFGKEGYAVARGLLNVLNA